MSEEFHFVLPCLLLYFQLFVLACYILYSYLCDEFIINDNVHISCLRSFLQEKPEGRLVTNMYVYQCISCMSACMYACVFVCACYRSIGIVFYVSLSSNWDKNSFPFVPLNLCLGR